MDVGFWDSIPIALVFAGIVLFTVFTFELGYQIGNYARAHSEKHSDTSPGPMVAGVLTMLAFILALTFNMAASRFDSRKQFVIEEVNAIGTTYLRADLLAEPQKSELKDLLRQYVDIRVEVSQNDNIDDAIRRSAGLQQSIWTLAVSVAKEEPVVLNSLLLQSLNEMIDLQEKRVNAAIRNRIPGSIWVTLAAIIALSMVTMGSQTGLVRTRRLMQVIPAVLAFSALLTVVVDLDRPSAVGFIHVSQQAMMDLQQSLQQAAQSLSR
ncbi:hypothetical protein GCM10011348_21080 [Marinobacterium nitratireducens]|uniref:DUF4239 domain-containing protein n=1 Tax=Marinobacterium nitratireducens TaxID=518897 RepID=A0A917ZEN5_9GAMM|nr:hypothetical protein [Marinobacterium nitratireducens]GGO81636.1 hypothetical protein GCM10011348_21080 [Marinobacterium nitratireducens]